MARARAVDVGEIETVIALAISTRERLAIEEMALATGETRTDNLIRSALWHYGRHLERRFPVDIFALRRDPTYSKRARRADPVARNEKAGHAGPPGIEAAPHVTDAGH